MAAAAGLSEAHGDADDAEQVLMLMLHDEAMRIDRRDKPVVEVWALGHSSTSKGVCQVVSNIGAETGGGQ